MSDYELDKLCEQNPHCGCNCISCQIYAQYVNSNNK